MGWRRPGGGFGQLVAGKPSSGQCTILPFLPPESTCSSEIATSTEYRIEGAQLESNSGQVEGRAASRQRLRLRLLLPCAPSSFLESPPCPKAGCKEIYAALNWTYNTSSHSRDLGGTQLGSQGRWLLPCLNQAPLEPHPT